MPFSRQALTTSAVFAASRRRPKLLQPRPTTDTDSDPILRVSMLVLAPFPVVDNSPKSNEERKNCHAHAGVQSGIMNIRTAETQRTQRKDRVILRLQTALKLIRLRKLSPQ